MLNLFRHEADHEEPCLMQQIFAGTSGSKVGSVRKTGSSSSMRKSTLCSLLNFLSIS